jgi:tetratricopeptide (TPR) repeat protein
LCGVLCAAWVAAFASGCGGGSAAVSTVRPPAPVNTAEVLRVADEHYGARADPARVREGLRALRQITAVEPNNYEAAWRVARLNYTLGDKSADDAERERAYTEGVEAAKAAVRAAPDRPEGHFWLAANTGGLAQSKPLLHGVTGSQKVRGELETVLRLDEGFQGGSAYMALGRLDLELPTVIGGDPERAVQTLEKGLRFGGQNSLLHLYLARAYLRVKRKDDARRELNYVLTMKPHPDFTPEHQEAVEKARELMGKNL